MNELRVLTWNIMRGENLRRVIKHVKDVHPDVWLAQEIQPKHHRLLEQKTGMRCYPAPRTANSINDNAIFVRERDDSPLVVEDVFEHPLNGWHPPANVTLVDERFRTEHGARPLSLVSHHLCYFSPDRRLAEAEWLTTLAKPGWLAFIGGDFNSYPAREAPTDETWAEVLAGDHADRAFYTNRTLLFGERRISDVRPHSTLTSAGFVDLALWARDRMGQPFAAEPTAGHMNSARQGGQWRIDWNIASRELAPAVLDVAVGEEMKHVSDHLPIVTRLDLDAVLESMRPALTDSLDAQA
ncbi:endonuclease/exonuclease/phosphatase family protein [Streptomyces sp. NPDC004435]|uniref:endonuclease/exonuclease/phosphatase family protein n=1 Tax=Streptomyces sp. NPDC004435 TaxID=3364701 RepID=UPI0036946D86